MGKPIYLCDVTVLRFSMRGKRRIIENEEVIRMPMLSRELHALDDQEYSHRMLARKFLPKTSRWELMDEFRKRYIVKDVTVVKQVGETNDEPDVEWI